MPQKSKATVAEKVAAVEDYLNGSMSPAAICAKLGVDYRTLCRWRRSHEAGWAEALTPALQTKRYPAELKLHVVKEYLSGGTTYAELCSKYSISDTRVVGRWIKKYNSHEDFKQPNIGGAIYKGRKTTLAERIEIVSHCLSNNKGYGLTIEK